MILHIDNLAQCTQRNMIWDYATREYRDYPPNDNEDLAIEVSVAQVHHAINTTDRSSDTGQHHE